MTTPLMLSSLLLLFAQVRSDEGLQAPPWIALALVWLILSLLNDRISTPFSWLIFTGMLYLHGEPVLRMVGNVGKKAKG